MNVYVYRDLGGELVFREALLDRPKFGLQFVGVFHLELTEQQDEEGGGEEA